MEKRGYSLIHRFFALLLCVAMLVPTALVPVSATEVTEPAETVITETVQTEATDPEESELEWILPECDCGSTEAEPGKHGETCARKVFLEEFCKETAAEIYSKWDKLPEECQKYILEYLGKDEADAEKLAELKGYVDAAQKEEEQAEEPAEETEGTTKETEGSTEETEGTTEETEESTEETKESVEAIEEGTEETEEAETEDATFTITRDGKTPLAVVYAASDFQPKNSSGDDVTGGKNLMNLIVGQMYNDGYTAVDGALICGDYSKTYNTWGKENVSYNNAGREAVAEVLGNTEVWGLSDAQVVYIQGNHDPAATTGLDPYGKNDTDKYGVFVIHEDNFPWKQGETANAYATVTDTADDLKEYLQEKVDDKDNRPIFVLSHVPLHYSNRTTSGKYGDNIYAKYIFDVLNEYGKQLNIIFLFGHNHSGTYDDYLGGGAVYLPKNDEILIPDAGKTDSFKSYNLNFTYMNAGYLGYYNGSCDTGLSSTIFIIYDDEVVVARYSANTNTASSTSNLSVQKSNLKVEGVWDKNHTNNTSGFTSSKNNTEVYSSTQSITLMQPFTEELKSEAMSAGVLTKGNSAEVSVAGVYGKTYTVEEWSSSDPSIAEVTASESDPMTATVTAKSTGTVKITARVAEVTKTRAVGETQTLEMEIEVLDVEPVILAEAGNHDFFILDDNQDSSTWTADTSTQYVLVTQDKGNPTAGQFMAMYYNQQADKKEGDDTVNTSGAWREINAEPITVMPLPIGGETVYAVSTTDISYQWKFKQYNRNDSYNWYYVIPMFDTARCLRLARGNDTNAIKNYDPDIDGLRMVPNTNTADGNFWRMSNRGAGLTTNIDGKAHYFSPYYDSIQGDITVYYTENGDENMGKRTYLYEKTTVTLDNPIIAFIKDTSGAVNKGVGLDAGTGDVIYIQNGDQVTTVPVTLNMLTGTFNVNEPDTYSGLTVTYAGKTITDNYTLTVREAVTLLENEGGKFRSTIYRQVEEMVGGRHYMIVDSAEVGEAHAMGVSQSATNKAGVTAHNVLIQPFTVGGQAGLYIDSTRYSDEPDNPTDSIIENHGDVNANISSEAHKAAIRLVWTPTVIHTAPKDSSNAFSTVYCNDVKNYRFLVSEYHDGRVWVNQTGRYDQPVMFWGGSTSVYEQWKYVATGSGSDHMQEGLVLNSGNVDNFRLFYSSENYNSSTYLNKNFITEGNTTYDPLRRRTWIYEQVDNIDTITARLSGQAGSVTAGCNASVPTGAYILVETFLTDGTVETVRVPLRVSMLSGDYNLNETGEYTGLTVTYQGKELSSNYTLNVAGAVADDYPDFPDEGAVRIDKQLDTTQYNYLSTGAASIDLSVTGIPAQTGVDILFMLDTSSSMYRCIHDKNKGANCPICGTVTDEDSRLSLLKQTLVKTLEDLQAPMNGYSPDIDVAVACFNGYTPINADIILDYTKKANGENVNTSEDATQISENRIDSSNISLNFTDVAKLTEADMQAAADGLYLNSGTNYDRGMELAYNMLKAKQEENALNGETRQQILVFMSDGVPYQFNYTIGTPLMSDWDNYLKGNSVTAVPKDEGAKELFNLYRNDNETLWMAEAIKGDPSEKYTIINPDLQDSNTKIDSVNGLGATIYTVGMGINDHMRISAEAANLVLKNIATPETTGKKYFYSCTNPSDFTLAFADISSTIRKAGNAAFTDQMGPDFDLITANVGKQVVTEADGTPAHVEEKRYDTPPSIVVREYELYKRSEIGDTLEFQNEDGTTTSVKVTEAMVGSRKPVKPHIIETVIFNDDGTAAYSTHVDVDNDGNYGATLNDEGVYVINDTDDNIRNNNVICAATFWFNDNQNSVKINVNGKQIDLEKECFYWNVGSIPQNELVLSYNVYLTGSMEGTRSAGTYDTNTHAELNYINYRNNPCELEVPTPKLPWKQATVGYGFYLVDTEGNPIINQTTGETGSFEQAVKITQPVYEDFPLNSGTQDIIADIVAGENLPEGYTLFDEDAQYKVQLNSDGTGYYIIVTDPDTGKQTTYVVGVSSTPVTGGSAAGEQKNTSDYATANTIVWFGVVATVQCVPDTVVIDFGLPVNIDVLSNDILMSNYGTLTYIGETTTITGTEAYKAALAKDSNLKLWEYLQNLAKDKVSQTPVFNSETVNGLFGTVSVVKKGTETTGEVCYTLNTSNGMQIEEEETFVYAVNYTGTVGTKGYYYSTVTVIPATTIYYEDNFVSYSSWKVKSDGTTEQITSTWKDMDPNADGANQAQDRPGEYSFPDVDANNIYGFDGAYTGMAEYSLGTAKHVQVKSGEFAEAQFTFNGTGFDIISLTNNVTGTITVDVYQADAFAADKYGADAVESHMVDTYYGYKWALCNVTYEWDVTTDNPDGIWVKTVQGEAAAGADEKKATLKQNPADGDTAQGVEYAWIPAVTSDALYQVPVMKVSGLPYNKYTVVITVWYESVLDHQKKGYYDFYLDAIRIYDPANDGAGNKVIEDAYKADGEGWPEYFELRNLIISKKDFDSLNDNTADGISGIVFIDNTNDTNQNKVNSIADYINYGPNNELYLAPGQSIAFKLEVPENVDTDSDKELDQIHLAMKSVGGTVYVKYYDAGSTAAENAPVKEIATATDLYYDITSLNGKTVVITNTGTSSNAILSITNVKVTYTETHADSIESGYFTVTEEVAETAVASLMMMRPPVVPEETVPETTVPEETVPETTVPEETVPETTVPEETEPEETVPETTVPETTVPEETEPEATESEEPEAFEPKLFDVRISDTTVKVGSKVTVTVTTGTDVDYITVNGTKVTSYSGSRYSSTRTWQVRVEAEEVGEMEVAVVCYNCEELASQPVVKTVSVTTQYTSITDEVKDVTNVVKDVTNVVKDVTNVVKDLITGFFDRLWGSR